MRKLFLALFLVTQLKDLKPGFNLFSPQQDIQVGQEAAAKVAAEQPVVQNEQLTGYLTDLLKHLANTPHGKSEFPYEIHAIASNGALTMADAEYNPLAMAEFFQKLEAKGARESRLAEFLSDHPSPGNRVKAVEDVVRQLPPRTYSADTERFRAIKQLISGIEIPPAPRPLSRNQ